MSHVKEIIIFFGHSACSPSKSIIYSRYNARIGQILSAWAPPLCQDLKADGNSCAEWMSSGGFEYVIGFLFSRGKTAVQWKALTLRSFVIWDSSSRKKPSQKVFFFCQGLENKQRLHGKQLSSVHGGTGVLQSSTCRMVIPLPSCHFMHWLMWHEIQIAALECVVGFTKMV